MDTLVIGLKDGEWDVIDPRIEEGRLPYFERLKETGISGSLQSITSSVSSPIWK